MSVVHQHVLDLGIEEQWGCSPRWSKASTPRWPRNDGLDPGVAQQLHVVFEVGQRGRGGLAAR